MILGASGYIGRNLVPWLAARGHSVRAVARRRAALDAEGWTGVEFATADALDRASLTPVLKDVDVAYYLVHSMGVGRDFPDFERRAAENFAAAAAEAGVRRIVYLGGLASAAGISRHLASRTATGEVLRAGTVPVIELRAGIIIGPGSAAFEVMRDLVAHLPAMVTPRWVRAVAPPIALEDLLADLEALGTADGVEGKILETGGPDRLTYEEMMRRLARALGKRVPLIIPVPVLTPELSALWLDLVTTVPAPLARALIGGMRQDLSADDTVLRQAVPRTCMGVDAAIDRALVLEREITVHDQWRDGAFTLRGGRSDRSFYAKRLSRSMDTPASPAAIWQALARMGTRQADDVLATPAWRLRDMIDRALGGVNAGPRDGTRPPTRGDRFGTWRVVASVPDRRVTLAANRIAPGAGGIEIELVPQEGGTRVVATMAWHPAGLGGLLYWFATWPVRSVVMRALAKRIARAS